MKYFVYRIVANPKGKTAQIFGYPDIYRIVATNAQEAEKCARSLGIDVTGVHEMFECIVVLGKDKVIKKVVTKKAVAKKVLKKVKRRK